MKPKRMLATVLVLLGLTLGHDALAYYNPHTGCWPNRDPLSDVAFLRRAFLGVPPSNVARLRVESLKPAYVFVSGNPIDRHDSDGRIDGGSTVKSIVLYCIDCAKYMIAGADAKTVFDKLNANYTCSCNGNNVRMSEYDGCITGDSACTWQVAHRIWGCYARKHGVPRSCVLLGNVAWEGLEGFGGEASKHGREGGYVTDTVNDVLAVLQGYDSGEDDCEHAFIPSGCEPNQ